jgi:hypothetical protein
MAHSPIGHSCHRRPVTRPELPAELEVPPSRSATGRQASLRRAVHTPTSERSRPLSSTPASPAPTPGESGGNSAVFRGNTVATSTSFRIVQPVQDLALDRTIWTPSDATSAPRARLRALSGVSRVGVRVSLGALLRLSSLAVRESARCSLEKKCPSSGRSWLHADAERPRARDCHQGT